jgi:uncharacterized repeat protein (TIGR03803 family)
MRSSGRSNPIKIWGVSVLMFLLSGYAWAGGGSQVLYRFPGGDKGNLPLASLVFDQAGNMYGTTYDGGTYGVGTVFELKRTKTGWKYQVIYSPVYQDGANPMADVIVDAAGNVYGTTFNGGSNACGTVFRLTPSNGKWQHTVLHSFAGSPSDGCGPLSLTMDAKANIYGTTTGGGDTSECFSGCGTVFELTPLNGMWTETVLYSFAGFPDAESPTSGVVLDASGNLYGETGTGGSRNGGTIFELSPSGNGWKEVLLYTFIQNQGYPLGGLVLDKTGTFYGATEAGPRESGFGTVFSLTHSQSGWTENILYAFSGSDGRYPRSGVTLDDSGNVYGTTAEGGSSNLGVVFKLQQKSWKETVLYNFLGNSEGDDPEDNVTFGPDGNLYGTSSSGLSRFYGGTVFRVKP